VQIQQLKIQNLPVGEDGNFADIYIGKDDIKNEVEENLISASCNGNDF